MAGSRVKVILSDEEGCAVITMQETKSSEETWIVPLQFKSVLAVTDPASMTSRNSMMMFESRATEETLSAGENLTTVGIYPNQIVAY